MIESFLKNFGVFFCDGVLQSKLQFKKKQFLFPKRRQISLSYAAVKRTNEYKDITKSYLQYISINTMDKIFESVLL